MKILKKKIYKYISKAFLDGCSSYNTLKVRKACRSKAQARKAFAAHNIPHAKGTTYILPFTALKFIKKHGFPVVIKPNLGGYSRGSYFPIQNYKDFWKAYFLAKIWWPKSVIEQYLLGKNYRVVVTKDGVEIAMQRFPAFVKGNGTDTISQLIDEENRTRIQMKLLPVIHTIEKNSAVKKHLKKNGWNFESIPKKDEYVELFHRVALSPGGVLKNIPIENITVKNKKLCEKILDIFDANIFGIDVIMEKGIEIDFDQQKCIFLELNSRPYLKMHSYPRWGDTPNMEKLYSKLNSLNIQDTDTF